jgi:hypothetical protein
MYSYVFLHSYKLYEGLVAYSLSQIKMQQIVLNPLQVKQTVSRQPLHPENSTNQA